MFASTDLQWALIGRNNKFYRVANKIRLSADPFNNSGKYTKRHSGFIQAKAAAVKMNGKTGELYVAVNNGENANKPKAMFTSTSTGVKAVSAVRPDLADVAFRRARKLQRTASQMKKVRAASAARSAKRTFTRSAAKKQ